MSGLNQFKESESDLTLELDNSGALARLTELALPLTPLNIIDAAGEFSNRKGQVQSYKESTDYDVIIDNKPYPPKVIFGLALSELTGQIILSNHFKGGLKSPCFRTLEKLGFKVQAKIKNITAGKS